MDVSGITLSDGFLKDDVKKEILDSETIIVKGDGTLSTVEDQNEIVTYRVVQVGTGTQNGTIPHIVSTTNAFNAATTVQPTLQTVLTNPLNPGLYVIGPSTTNDVYNNTRTSNNKPIAPKISNVETIRNNSVQTSGFRDDKRRATHNEIERKRRDKINNWIIKLSKIIPECKESTKNSYDGQQSKGGILANACSHILELKSKNEKLMEKAKQCDSLAAELQIKTKQLELVLSENKELKMLLGKHGINHSKLSNENS